MIAVDGLHLSSFLDFGYRGEFRLYANLELAAVGLLVLAAAIRWGALCSWAILLRPTRRITTLLGLLIAALALTAGLLVDPSARSLAAFKPINPVAQPVTWSISILALLLGAIQQEIWFRALLQTSLARVLANRWLAIALTAAAGAYLQPGHRVEAFCLSVFLGIVFHRTRSLFCTTALHIVFSLTMGILNGGTFMVASLVNPSVTVKPNGLVCVGLLIAGALFEMRHRRAPHQIRQHKALGLNLCLLIGVFVFNLILEKLLVPVGRAAVAMTDWLNPSFIWKVQLGAHFLITAIVLAWFRWGPALRDLFAPRFRVTGILGLITALIPCLAAAIALPNEFFGRPFELRPSLFTSVEIWRVTVFPVAINAFSEELVFRACVQPLFSRLLCSAWAGALISTWAFVSLHPSENWAFLMPGSLILAIAFMHTQSVVCTTVLHILLNLTMDFLHGDEFTVSEFISSDAFHETATPVYLGLSWLFVIGLAWWWRKREGRLSAPFVFSHLTSR